MDEGARADDERGGGGDASGRHYRGALAVGK
jgi:hypothetical protein